MNLIIQQPVCAVVARFFLACGLVDLQSVVMKIAGAEPGVVGNRTGYALIAGFIDEQQPVTLGGEPESGLVASLSGESSSGIEAALRPDLHIGGFRAANAKVE
jgi:hypothetical protein